MILNHLREVWENLTNEDLSLISSMQAAAVAYACGQTGLSAEELDNFEDITIAVLDVISDMWDNRSLTIDRTAPNTLVDNILFMHSVNLLPTAEVN